MRDIKIKKHGRQPKIKNAASRMPKELVRTAVLKAREKSNRAVNTKASKESEASPTEYASEKIRSTEEQMAGKTGAAAIQAGRTLSKKSYEKIKERRREAEYTEETEAGRKTWAETGKASAEGAGEPRQAHTVGHHSATPMVEKERTFHNQDALLKRVKERPKSRELIRTAAKREIRTASKLVKTSPVLYEKIKADQTAVQQKQTLHTIQTARRTAAKKTVITKQVKTAGKTTKTSIRGVKAALQKAIVSVKTMGTLLASAGGFLLVFVIIAGILAGAMFSGSSQSAEPLSQEVLNYAPVIQKYATKYRIPDYASVLQAIMMQESGGRGNDPMQSSECPYNTRFPNSPNAITDPEYSIQVGVQYYASCVVEAGCESPYDMDKLKLSLQGYNYGNGYITWAIRKHGGYSEANALQFSQEQAASHGWARYGDPEYVPHVLRYYAGGMNLFAGLFGNEQIVTIAKAQIGNEGGQKFWSWYGFGQRVSWCACFVSWCADQCGLIESGSIPKFASCPEGITWFTNQGRWKDRSYVPGPGTIIFFDWPDRNTGIRDGVSDHVGIVEKCENGIVYTIEGNSGNACRQRSYTVGNESILGYGVLLN